MLALHQPTADVASGCGEIIDKTCHWKFILLDLYCCKHFQEDVAPKTTTLFLNAKLFPGGSEISGSGNSNNTNIVTLTSFGMQNIGIPSRNGAGRWSLSEP